MHSHLKHGLVSEMHSLNLMLTSLTEFDTYRSFAARVQ